MPKKKKREPEPVPDKGPTICRHCNLYQHKKQTVIVCSQCMEDNQKC